MKLSNKEINSRFRGPGRPREYDFSDMEVGTMKFIPCKAQERDGKLVSIRSNISKLKKATGMQFKATATDTGVEVVRVS